MIDSPQRRGFMPRRLLRRLLWLLTQAINARIEGMADRCRSEVHRLIALLALSIVAGCFVVGAVAFAVFGVILALWETHRVLSFELAAAALALCAALALALARRNVRRARRRV